MSDPFKNPPPPTPEHQAWVEKFDQESAEWDAMNSNEQRAFITSKLNNELALVPGLVETIASAYGEDAFYNVTSKVRALVGALEKQEVRRNRVRLKYIVFPQEGASIWGLVYYPGHAHVDGHRWWDQGGSVLATFSTQEEAFDAMLRCAPRMQADPCFDHYPGGEDPEEPVYFTLTHTSENTIYRGTLAHVGCLLGVRRGARVLDINDPRISLDVREIQVTVGAGLPTDEDGHRVGHWGLAYNQETGVETWPIEEAPQWWLEPWGQDPDWVAPPPDEDEDEAAA